LAGYLVGIQIDQLDDQSESVPLVDATRLATG
jgi:hypothetical protein